MDAQQPVAYEVVSDRGREAVYAAELRSNAEAACALNGWRLVPIYERLDEVARLRLADAEREAVEKAASAYQRRTDDGVGLLDDGPAECGEIAATLRGLLERLK